MKPTLFSFLLLLLWGSTACTNGSTGGANGQEETSAGRPELVSQLEIYDLEQNTHRIIYTDTVRFEAPNWTPDGRFLIFNQGGHLYRIPTAGGSPEMIDTGIADCCNNDHGISPDGTQLVISHNLDCEGGKSTIYVLPIEGGEPRRVTEKYPSYWHGWSPDGRTLAYVALRNDDYDIYTIPVEGGAETRLTTAEGLDDGPDYSPDGQYLYFNSVRTGTMEIYRMGADGSDPEQLTNDELNNWFPHPDPTGRYIVYIAYISKIDPNTHPPDMDVKLRLMDLESMKIRDLARFTGGQGSINVPSWSPDGRYFAFVSYQVNGN